MRWTHGHFHWNELLSRDTARDRAFYGTTIGWAFDPMETPDGSPYWIASIGGTPVAGMMDISAAPYERVPQAWMCYLAVDDVDARIRAAVAAGATLMRPIFEVPNVGRIAILTEPGGAGIGWMTPAS